MKKRILTTVLALAMCLVLFPAAPAMAETVTNVNGANMTISNVVSQRMAPVKEFEWWTTFEGEIEWVSTYLLQFDTVQVYYCDAPATITLTQESCVEIINWYYDSEIADSSVVDQIEWNENEWLVGDVSFTERGTYLINDGYTATFGSIFLIVGSDDSTPSAPSTTTDTPSSWAVDEVNAAIEVGLVPENLQKNYASPITRGDVAQMFINLIEQSSGLSIDDFMASKEVSINNAAFEDTTDKAVLAANALGIINGMGDGRFNPNGTLTRAQIAAIINRAANVLGVDTAGYSHSFTDVVGHWVDAELGWPLQAEIVNGIGDNKYDPEGRLTTEQAIAITYRALKYLTD